MALTLPFARPESVLVDARLETLDFTRGALVARALHPFSAKFQARRLALEGLELEGNGVSLALDASLGLDPALPVDGRVRFDIDLSRLPERPGWTMTGPAPPATSTSPARDKRAFGTVQAGTNVEIKDASSTLLTLADGQIEMAGDAATIPGLHATVPVASSRYPAAFPSPSCCRSRRCARSGSSRRDRSRPACASTWTSAS